MIEASFLNGIVVSALLIIWLVIVSKMIIANARNPSIAYTGHDREIDRRAFFFFLPWQLRPGTWWRRIRSRRNHPGEVLVYMASAEQYEIVFPVARDVVSVDLRFAESEAMSIASVEYHLDEQSLEPPCQVRLRMRGKKPGVRIRFGPHTYLTKITVYTTLNRTIDCVAEARLIDHGEPDGRILAAANRIGYSDAGAFCARLAEYDRNWPDNRFVITQLMLHYQALGCRDLAELYAVRAAALGQIEPSLDLYCSLRIERPWHHSNSFIAGLREQVEGWDLAGHHGLVTLDLQRSFLIAPNGVERERYHAVKLVRRRAAARKFTHLDVPMVSRSGGLLFTAARVIRADGTVVTLDEERFSVGSAEDDNPFIAVARRHSGTWILPDLERGDAVEFVYDLVRLHGDAKGEQRRFMLANLADPGTPTLKCQVAFTAPRHWNLDFALRNADAQRSEGIEDELGYKTVAFRQLRVLPRQSHSEVYQRYTLNPLVACATRDGDWAGVADRLFGIVHRRVEATTEVPALLSAAIGDATEPREILARAFYWVRDHIKYGSVASANEALDDPDRAERIVATGTGDCKDLSFLLAVVCNQHGIPWEFVLLASRKGVVLDELPADQFDHVIVRAQVGGEWLYLDAASDEAVFSGVNAAAQGLKGLAGGATCALVTMPELPGEANQVRVHEIIESIEDGWLIARVDIVVAGSAARALEEAWKHHSLTSLDPERGSDIVANSLLPDFLVDDATRHQSTADSDALHLSLVGRRNRLLSLGDERIAAFGLGIPLLPYFRWRGITFTERFVFPMKAEIEYRLEIVGDVRNALRDLSTVKPLDCGFCTVSEEPVTGADRTGFVRRVSLLRRIVEGSELDSLPTLIEHLDDTCRVVARFEPLH